MFCLDIPNLPFGWQPCYLRLPPCFIHISSVQAPTQKQQTCCIWSLWCFDEITHTPKHVFHLSVYCFIQPWWLSSICFHNIRLQHISIREVYPFKPSSLVWCERGKLQPQTSCAFEWPYLWVILPSELLLTACSQGNQLSFSSWLFLLWSWTACCY